MNSNALKNQLNSDDDLLPEYSFNYQNAKPNSFANRGEVKRLNVVVLDEDVARVFTTPEAVNKVLRALSLCLNLVELPEFSNALQRYFTHGDTYAESLMLRRY
jgi:hypothetical protein